VILQCFCLFCCVNNVGGQHRWLFAFLADCYELTLILYFYCLILLLFVANKFLLLLYTISIKTSSACRPIDTQTLYTSAAVCAESVKKHFRRYVSQNTESPVSNLPRILITVFFTVLLQSFEF